MDNKVDNILLLDSMFKIEEAKGNVVRKSSKKSSEVRQAGNRIYLGKHVNGQEDHKKILALYSESIALAPKDSEELATAYSNRSALFKHLNFKEKCLIDIDRALRITKSDNLKIKLLARKTECLKLKDEVDTSEKDSNLNNDNTGSDKQSNLVPPTTQKLRLPSFIPSQEIPCAAESITIAYNKSLGRHIVATRDIKPGEVIVVEEGYAVFPMLSKMYLICSYCMTIALDGIPCDDCALAFYCSQECKKKAWEEYHDVECSILPFLLNKSLIKENDTRFIVLAAKCFIKAVKSEGLASVLMNCRMIDKDDKGVKNFLSNGIYDNKKFRFCYNLLSDKNTVEKNIPWREFYSCILITLFLKHSTLMEKYKIIKDGNLTIINKEEVSQIKNIFTKIIGIVATNVHTFQGSLCVCSVELSCGELCTGRRGPILASCCSLFNHSCHPNISRMFMPERKVVIFTTCPVKKGEQLCDTYGVTIRYSNKLVRELSLGFKCKCQACHENWTMHLSRSVKLKFKNLNPKWYRKHYLQLDVDQWPYNEETMKDVVKASELAYQSFNPNEAYLLSIPCRDYIDKSFYKFYGIDCQIPDKC